MYFKKWNRILSVICAAALSMSCMATLPAAATSINLVSNSTFDSGTSGWDTYQASGGKASLTVNAVKDERRLTAEVALGQEGVTM